MRLDTFSINSEALKKTSFMQWSIRFLFGGSISLITALLSKKFGPAMGGLFLAFPSIMPATVTLVQKQSGRSDAIRECFGAILGSVGLIGFALTVYFCAESQTALPSLLMAFLIWMIVSLALWRVLAKE